MLWAGSADVYYHNRPRMAAEWLTEYGKGRPWRAEIAGRTGAGVQMLVQADAFKPEYGLAGGQSLVDKISSGKYTYVVLEAPTASLTGADGEAMRRALEVCAKAAREAGGEPVYFESGFSESDPGRAQLLESARANDVRLLLPCAGAWQQVRSVQAEIQLHDAIDKARPGPLGHYLNLCCTFAVLAGRHPKALPLEYLVWVPLTDAAIAQADRKLAGAPTRDPYLLALPDFLKRRTILAEPYTIDKATARTLQNTAWDVWRETQKALKGA